MEGGLSSSSSYPSPPLFLLAGAGLAGCYPVQLRDVRCVRLAGRLVVCVCFM